MFWCLLICFSRSYTVQFQPCLWSDIRATQLILESDGISISSGVVYCAACGGGARADYLPLAGQRQLDEFPTCQNFFVGRLRLSHRLDRWADSPTTVAFTLTAPAPGDKQSVWIRRDDLIMIIVANVSYQVLTVRVARSPPIPSVKSTSHTVRVLCKSVCVALLRLRGFCERSSTNFCLASIVVSEQTCLGAFRWMKRWTLALNQKQKDFLDNIQEIVTPETFNGFCTILKW